jgi:hypothetical protein
MTCGCTASSIPVIPYQGGGKRRKRSKTTRRKPKTKRRRGYSIKKKRKLYGGNYLTGTIADGSEGTALGNMLGSQHAGNQRAGSSWEINQDPIKQPFSKL